MAEFGLFGYSFSLCQIRLFLLFRKGGFLFFIFDCRKGEIYWVAVHRAVSILLSRADLEHSVDFCFFYGFPRFKKSNNWSKMVVLLQIFQFVQASAHYQRLLVKRGLLNHKFITIFSFRFFFVLVLFLI